jgi:hypothetical protein
VANTNESFIDEVAEAVRRDRLNQWFRRWGWLVGVAILAIITAAAVMEWRESRRQADAAFRGDAILSALDIQNAEDRLAALAELPREGEAGAVTALLLAAEQQAAGDLGAAGQTLDSVAADGSVSPLYRDLAAFKSLLVQGPDADPAALEALAAPGGPFRLLALEQLALIDLSAGNRDAAVERLQAITEDAGIAPGQQGRIEALLNALGVPSEEEPADAEAEVPAPTGE